MNVLSNFIYNEKQNNLNAFQWENGKSVVHLWNITRQWKGTIDVYTTPWMDLEDTEWKKPISKDFILYDSIYITFLKWQKYRDGEQICGHQGLGMWERSFFVQYLDYSGSYIYICDKIA